MKSILNRPEWCPLEKYQDNEEGIWVLHQNPLTKHGKWVCSKCMKAQKKQTRFCPECGIEMKWYDGESI